LKVGVVGIGFDVIGLGLEMKKGKLADKCDEFVNMILPM